jgi:hypothetical protein
MTREERAAERQAERENIAEVRSWRQAVYEETKNMTKDELAAHRNDLHEFCLKHGLKVASLV